MEKIKKCLKWFYDSFIWLGVLLLIADLVSKLLVIANKDAIRAQGGIVLIPNFLRINYLINNNLVFGISTGSDLSNRVVFCCVAGAIVIGVIFFTIKKWGKLNKMFKAGIMMVLAGALGNMIDRLFYSPEFLDNSVNGVVDWIDFYGVWAFNFNIADSSVVVAAFMLIIYMLVADIIDYKNKPKEPKSVESSEKVLSKTEREKQEFIENQDKDSNE